MCTIASSGRLAWIPTLDNTHMVAFSRLATLCFSKSHLLLPTLRNALIDDSWFAIVAFATGIVRGTLTRHPLTAPDVDPFTPSATSRAPTTTSSRVLVGPQKLVTSTSLHPPHTRYSYLFFFDLGPLSPHTYCAPHLRYSVAFRLRSLPRYRRSLCSSIGS